MQRTVPRDQRQPPAIARQTLGETRIGLWLTFAALAIMVVLAMATTVWLIIAFRDLPRTRP